MTQQSTLERGAQLALNSLPRIAITARVSNIIGVCRLILSTINLPTIRLISGIVLLFTDIVRDETIGLSQACVPRVGKDSIIPSGRMRVFLVIVGMPLKMEE